MTELPALVRALSTAGVEFIVVGGAAATAHGSARLTFDLDIVYRRTSENIARVVASLAPHRPYLRGAPPGLPFHWESVTIERGLNFTLTTDVGPIDLLGEITGGGGYDDLLQHTIRLEIFGTQCLCLTLEQLIVVKRAAGRVRDLEAIAELEAIRDERDHHAS
jgi:predicted nucleotidyltransferase